MKTLYIKRKIATQERKDCNIENRQERCEYDCFYPQDEMQVRNRSIVFNLKINRVHLTQLIPKVWVIDRNVKYKRTDAPSLWHQQ